MYFKRAALGCGSTVAHAINCVRPLCGRRSGTISGYFWASCAGHAAHWAQAQGNHPLGRSSCAKEARPTAEQPIARPAADMCEQTRRLSAGGDELSPRPSRPPSLGLAARRGMRVYAGGSILARLSQAKLPLRRKCSRMEVGPFRPTDDRCRCNLEVRGQLNRCHVIPVRSMEGGPTSGMMLSLLSVIARSHPDQVINEQSAIVELTVHRLALS
ncbi:hypothetical protein ACVIGA_008955 [Bradyrhizobium sp. USDA 3240]